MEAPPLVSQRIPVDKFQQMVKQELSSAERLKEEGVQAFREAAAGDSPLSVAAEKFAAALDAVEAILEQPGIKHKELQQLNQRAAALRLQARPVQIFIVILLNVAATSLKRNEPLVALGAAKAALEVDPRCVKGHYRAAQASLALGDHAAAVESANKALALDPTSREVQQLARRARADGAATCRPFVGLFAAGSSPYSGPLSPADAEDDARCRRERTSLAPRLTPHLRPGPSCPDPGAVLSRWVSSGLGPLDTPERQCLESAVRRTAAAGGLDTDADRRMITSHGFGAALLSEAERRDRDDARELAEVKRIVVKAKRGDALTPDELVVMDKFRRAEIVALERKFSVDGLTQEEAALLAKLREQQQSAEAAAERAAGVESRLAAILQKLDKSSKLTPRERYDLYATLEVEEAALQAREDGDTGPGLSSEEHHLLRRLKAIRKERDDARAARRRSLASLVVAGGGAVGTTRAEK